MLWAKLYCTFTGCTVLYKSIFALAIVRSMRITAHRVANGSTWVLRITLIDIECDIIVIFKPMVKYVIFPPSVFHSKGLWNRLCVLRIVSNAVLFFPHSYRPDSSPREEWVDRGTLWVFLAVRHGKFILRIMISLGLLNNSYQISCRFFCYYDVRWRHLVGHVGPLTWISKLFSQK